MSKLAAEALGTIDSCVGKTDTAPTNFDNPLTLFSILGCGTVALVTFLVLPLYVGLMAQSFGFSESQLGILASMDLVGIALMSLSAPLWINRWNWRLVARGALLWMIACNIVSVVVTDLWALCLIRFMAGASGGLLAVMVISCISFTRNPDRVMALFVVCQVSIQVIGFLVLPTVLAQWGVSGFFTFLSIIAVLGLILSVYFPTAGREKPEFSDTAGNAHQQLSGLHPVWALVGMALFFIAQVSVFSFIERLGVNLGFSAQDIGSALTAAVIIGLAGAILGAVVSIRFGRLMPLLISAIVQIVCFAALAGNIQYSLFIVLAALLQFFWNLPLGYHIGVLIAEDPGHKFVVLVPFMQMLGIAIGPFLGGFALELGGFNGLMSLAAVSLLLYLMLFFPLAKSQDKAALCISGEG
jgi:predicted MFS family arabinose efflux permease